MHAALFHRLSSIDLDLLVLVAHAFLKPCVNINAFAYDTEAVDMHEHRDLLSIGILLVRHGWARIHRLA